MMHLKIINIGKTCFINLFIIKRTIIIRCCCSLNFGQIGKYRLVYLFIYLSLLIFLYLLVYKNNHRIVCLLIVNNYHYYDKNIFIQ